MPLRHTQRKLRKLKRTANAWMKVITLTLEGNQVDRKSKLDGADHPVLLLQGLGSTRRTLSVIERRLQRDGHRVFSIHLGGMLNTFNSKKIEESARLVREKIEALYAKYQFKGKMSIIGHSKGGLIGRYYIQFLDGHSRVRHLVTLGTPHNGNPWALLGSLTPLGWIVKSLRQMSPTSELIKKLQSAPFPKEVQMTSIYSHSDLLNPYPGALVDLGPDTPNIRNICVDGVGHVDFLVKKSVYSHVKFALRETAPIVVIGKTVRTPAPSLRLVKVS